MRNRFGRVRLRDFILSPVGRKPWVYREGAGAMGSTSGALGKTCRTAIVALAIASILALPALGEETAPGVVAATPPEAASADETAEADRQSKAAAADKARIDKLESTVEVIAEELSRAVTAATVPEDVALTSFSGLGPAASKVYYHDKGLSIGGYGEVVLKATVTDENDGKGGTVSKNDVFDALRAVLYVGYKFNDQWVVNTELEFEHGGTGAGGSVSAEFITVDWLPREEFNMRVGLVLLPMGFINEIHEPTFFHGVFRPSVELQIIPTTWRENGGGVFGEIGGRFRYRMYAVNGMNAKGFSVSGIRGGRQNGGLALVNNWAFVGRFDFDVVNGLIFGGSAYSGKSGQNQMSCGPTCATTPANMGTVVPGTPTTLYEFHAEYKRYGMTLRGLFTQAFIGDAAQLNVALNNTPTGQKAIASRMMGWYAQGAYDVMPLILDDTRMSLEPYFRYEYVDTQNKMPVGYLTNYKFAQDIYTVGLQFKPIPQIVFKLDYQNIRPESDPDDVADLVNFGVGYVF